MSSKTAEQTTTDGHSTLVLYVFLCLCAIFCASTYATEICWHYSHPWPRAKLKKMFYIPTIAWCILAIIRICGIEKSAVLRPPECTALAMDADIGGIGIRIGLYLPAIAVSVSAVMGQYHNKQSGCKELGIVLMTYLLILAYSLATSRKDLNFHETILACMLMDVLSAAISITFSHKESLSSRWYVAISCFVQIFAATVTAVALDNVSLEERKSSADASNQCCTRIIWWGTFDSCEPVPKMFWAYFVLRLSNLLHTGWLGLHFMMYCKIAIKVKDAATTKFQQRKTLSNFSRICQIFPKPISKPFQVAMAKDTVEIDDETYSDMRATIFSKYSEWIPILAVSVISSETNLLKLNLSNPTGGLGWGQISALVAGLVVVIRWALATKEMLSYDVAFQHLKISQRGCFDLASHICRPFTGTGLLDHERFLFFEFSLEAEQIIEDRQRRKLNAQGDLESAIKIGDIFGIRAAIEDGAGLGIPNLDGDTPLLSALDLDLQDEVYVELVEKTTAVNNKSRVHGETALWRAASQGRQNLVEHLLQKIGIDVNIKGGPGGRTPLLEAVFRKQLDIARILLTTHDIDLATKDISGNTLLSAAVTTRNPDLVRDIIQKGDGFVNSENNHGETAALSHSANMDDIDVNKTGRDTYGQFVYRLTTIVQFIRNMEAIVPNVANSVRRTALHLAVRNGHFDIMQLLVSIATIDPNVADSEGKTTLHLAAERGYIEMAQLLVTLRKINLNVADSNGRTALHLSNGHFEITRLLISMETINLNAADFEGKTALHLALERGHKDITQLLISKGTIKPNVANFNPNVADFNGKTVLHIASAKGINSLCGWLLQCKLINVNIADSETKTALHYAVEFGLEDTLKLLLRVKNINVNAKNGDGQTPLLVAAKSLPGPVKYNFLDKVEQLLQHKGININSQDREGRTALSWATINGCKSAIKLLLQADGVDINLKDERGRTPLSFAAARGWGDICELFLRDHRIDINAETINGDTALSLAINCGPAMPTDVDINQHNSVDTTPLELAVDEHTPHRPRWERMGLINKLLENSETNINAQKANGMTALSVACQIADEVVVRSLLRRPDINIDSKCQRGWTACMYATKAMRDPKPVEDDATELRALEAKIQSCRNIVEQLGEWDVPKVGARSTSDTAPWDSLSSSDEDDAVDFGFSTDEDDAEDSGFFTDEDDAEDLDAPDEPPSRHEESRNRAAI